MSVQPSSTSSTRSLASRGRRGLLLLRGILAPDCARLSLFLAVSFLALLPYELIATVLVIRLVGVTPSDIAGMLPYSIFTVAWVLHLPAQVWLDFLMGKTAYDVERFPAIVLLVDASEVLVTFAYSYLLACLAVAVWQRLRPQRCR